MADKSPSFQFYPSDYLDKKVMRMSYEAQGIYVRILCHMWNDSNDQCSIENDLKMIANMLGVTRKKIEKIFKEIQWENDPIFISENGRFISKRLRKEKEKQTVRREKRQGAANKRWEQSTCNADAKQCLSSSSSSSSSTSKNKKNKGDKSPDSHSKGKKPKKNYAPSVNMTEEEYQKLIDRFGPDQTKRMIEKLSNYKESKGKRYKSDYHAILNWVVKECGVTELTNKPDLTEQWIKGEPVAGGKYKCPSCGGIICHFQKYIGKTPTAESDTRCGKCGEQYRSPPVSEEEKQKIKKMAMKGADDG